MCDLLCDLFIFFFKQKTAYEMRISDWSSDVCSSDLREGIRRFAEGLEEILVVEEKRAVIENQVKEQLYNWRGDARPRVVGKFDETGEWLLPSTGELTPARIARAIAKRIARFHTSEDIPQRLRFLAEKERAKIGRAHV